MMGGRAKLVLLDAGAVFGALEHDAWEGLTNAYEVVVPRIVLDEVQFYMSRGTGKRVYVDTDEWIRAGAIVCYEATACAVAETLKLVNWPDGPDIHDGEAEALTYLRLQVDPLAEHVAFVSADGGGNPGDCLAWAVTHRQVSRRGDASDRDNQVLAGPAPPGVCSAAPGEGSPASPSQTGEPANG